MPSQKPEKPLATQNINMPSLACGLLPSLAVPSSPWGLGAGPQTMEVRVQKSPLEQLQGMMSPRAGSLKLLPPKLASCLHPIASGEGKAGGGALGRAGRQAGPWWGAPPILPTLHCDLDRDFKQLQELLVLLSARRTSAKRSSASTAAPSLTPAGFEPGRWLLCSPGPGRVSQAMAQPSTAWREQLALF